MKISTEKIEVVKDSLNLREYWSNSEFYNQNGKLRYQITATHKIKLQSVHIAEISSAEY